MRTPFFTEHLRMTAFVKIRSDLYPSGQTNTYSKDKETKSCSEIRYHSETLQRQNYKVLLIGLYMVRLSTKRTFDLSFTVCIIDFE